IRVLPVLACLASLATSWSRGQVDVVMLAALSLAIYLAVHRREVSAGIFLSVPAAIKLFPALLLLFPVWRARWRMVAGAVLGLFLTFVLLPVVTFGPGRTVELYQTWRHVLIEPAFGQGTDSSRALELTQMSLRDNQSLLSFIHNLRYHHLSRDHRPPGAPLAWRMAVGFLGAVILLGIGVVSGLRRRDSPPQILILCGLLIGLAMLVTPVVHHCYYLLLLPLLSALIDHKLPEVVASIRDLRLPTVVTFFMLTDMLVRIPQIGFWLRDGGVPLLTLVSLMTAGALLLWRQRGAEPQRRKSEAFT
ncbi:MAG: DUF2029 domain-containing protein, partial [Verrucomicrobiota bacterium]|nr:DUF2029 domain-containing protein [Verrucomicrobiota bacterium]